MTAAPDSRVERICDLLLGAAPEEWPAILARECGDDRALRRTVEHSMARIDPRYAADRTLRLAPWHSGDLADLMAGSPGAAPLPPDPPALAPGDFVGEFRILALIDHGGFGEVYSAARGSAKYATAAIKLPRSAAPNFLHCFEAERRTLDRLDHPGIAHIYSSGTTPGGRPYIAMEFVTGADGETRALPITRYAEERSLTLRERLALFVPVCEAMHHAHTRGVFHCDLKPSNILVGVREGRPQPKIIDFGIAATTVEVDRDTTSSEAPPLPEGRVFGTPRYMSPEQLRGHRPNVLSDVYSLGVVLYELLCGVHPLPRLREGRGAEASVQALRDGLPQAPSEAIRAAGQAVAKARRGKPEGLAKELRGDLEKILLRILDPDPPRRFQSANAVAEELTRFLHHQPIASRPHSFRYVFGRALRRHRVAFAAAGIAVTALLATVAVVVWFWNSAVHHQREMRVYEANANIRGLLYERAQEDGRALGVGLEVVPPDLREWEWHHLHWITDHSLVTSAPLAGLVSAMAIAPGGDRVLAGDRRGSAGFFKLPTLEAMPSPSVETVPRTRSADIWTAAWHPAGHLFALGGFDDTVRVHARDGALRYRLSDQDGVPYKTVYAVAFTRDGKHLAVAGGGPGGSKSFLALHESESGRGRWVERPHGAPITEIAFSADGKWMATSGDDRQVILWNVERAIPEAVGNLLSGGEVNAVAFAPDSGLLAAGTTARDIVLARVPSLERVATLRGHREALAALAFHPRGHLLASASWDSTIRIWSVPSGDPVGVLLGHRGRVNRVAFTDDGQLLSASDDRTLRSWDVHRQRAPRALRVSTARLMVLSCLEGNAIAALDTLGTLQVLDMDSGEVRFRTTDVLEDSIATSSDGKRIHWCTRSEVHTWTTEGRLASHPLPVPLGDHGRSGALVDSQGLTFANHEGCWRLDEGAGRWIRVRPAQEGSAGPYSQHRYVDEDGAQRASLRQMDGTEGVVLLREGRSEVLSEWRLRWNSEGRYALLVDETSRVLGVCDAGSGKIVSTLHGHRERILGAAFSRSMRRLATAGADRTVRIWDWQRGQQLIALDYPDQPGRRDRPSFRSVAWTRDDATIVTGSTDGTLHFWKSRD